MAQQPESSSFATIFPIDSTDLVFEEEILRNPYGVKIIEIVYERALKEIPGSYKIWKEYLDFLVETALSSRKWWPSQTSHYKDGTDIERRDSSYISSVNACFERCLVYLHKMPRIWLDFAVFLMRQKSITATRRLFDRALRSLPITQHDRLWDMYLRFANSIECLCPETSRRIIERCSQVRPSLVKKHVELLIKTHNYDLALTLLTKHVKVADIESLDKSGGTNGEEHLDDNSPAYFWEQLCELLTLHANQINQASVEATLRSIISKTKDRQGHFWTLLASCSIRSGNFEKTRDTFEEGMSKVYSVRDFSQVFGAYTKFEESLLASDFELLTHSAMQASKAVKPNQSLDAAISEDLNFRLSRLRFLLNRRPFLASDVLLRQYPHNPEEWLRRVELIKKYFRNIMMDNGHEESEIESLTNAEIVNCYETALRVINPQKAPKASLAKIWIGYGQFYRDLKLYDEARQIFERALKVKFASVDDLAKVCIAYVEFEIQFGDPASASDILARTTAPAKIAKDKLEPSPENNVWPADWPQAVLHKNAALWSFVIDFEESRGSPPSTRAAYERVMELKLATPQTIINYALFLEEHGLFDDAFKVYERGIEIFGYPIAFDIWNIYLPKFLKRYGSSKLERTRDLFEQAVRNCPSKFAKSLYLMYADFEQKHGLSRNALRIYARAVEAVEYNDKVDMYMIYIKSASEVLGLSATREIYENAIKSLQDQEAKDICLQYAEMETRLGEIDRTRAIYGYASQFCDPRTVPIFWSKWQEFETKYGDEVSFREMLRIKRSIQTRFADQLTFVAAQVNKASSNAPEPAEKEPDGKKMPNSEEVSLDLD